ncbi:MAG TPA: preprotein translocase subunit SecE [Caulobacterales bacterium]|nr:preprotein translocase subunit SecE [Caulobacterales bacterium]
MDTADQEQLEPKRRGGPLTFAREVRAEGRKVTWATRQEVMVSTIMVLIMGTVAGIFFFVVDFLLGNGINWLLHAFSSR